MLEQINLASKYSRLNQGLPLRDGGHFIGKIALRENPGNGGFA